MRLSIDSDEALMRDTANDVLRTAAPLRRVLELDSDPEGFDAGMWRRAVALGWTTMAVPEEFGGASSRLESLGVILEEVGYSGWGSPLAPLAFATAVLSRLAATSTAAAHALRGIASNRVVVGTAPLDIDGRAASRSTTAGLAVTAVSLPIPWAHRADQLVVVARRADENIYDVVQVDVPDPHLTIIPAHSLDNERVGIVRLDDVQVGPDKVLASGLDARDVDSLLAPARALSGALQVGHARRILDMTAEHLRNREQFGRALGTLPTAQQACADMAIGCEGARLATYDALSRHDLGVAADSISAVAAYTAGQAGASASIAAAQLHGALGFMRDYPFQIFFRRAKAWQIRLGSLRGQRLALARILLPTVRIGSNLALDGPDPLDNNSPLMAGAT